MTAYVALGSNVGDRHAHIQAALDAITRLPGTRLLAVSPIIQTDPVGPVAQGPFLNAAAAVSTTLPPRKLLAHFQEIERTRGRDRSSERRWGPRTLDLDLLVFGDLVIDEPGLTIPHPRLHERRFVLEPLATIAPELVVPTLGRTVAELAASLPARPGARSGTISA